jgi:hypothetical protein
MDTTFNIPITPKQGGGYYNPLEATEEIRNMCKDTHTVDEITISRPNGVLTARISVQGDGEFPLTMEQMREIIEDSGRDWDAWFRRAAGAKGASASKAADNADIDADDDDDDDEVFL